MSCAISNARELPEHGAQMTVALHPLVIVNLTDHFTRLNLHTPAASAKPAASAAAAPPQPPAVRPPARAIGALYGQQHQRRLEIHTSFEVLNETKKAPDGTEYVAIDHAYMKKKKEQYNQVFPDYEVLGWYTTGSGLTHNDIAITHKALIEAGGIESPLILVMDTSPGPNMRILPVYIFETLEGNQGKQQQQQGGFPLVRKIKFTVESEETERIGVATAMNLDTAQDNNRTLVPTAQRLSNAILMLRARVQIVLKYLEGVKDGSIQPDFELLREIRCICNMLPSPESLSFTTALKKDYEDAVLTVYLAMLSKTTAVLSKVVDKSAVFTNRRRPMGAGMLWSGFVW